MWHSTHKHTRWRTSIPSPIEYATFLSSWRFWQRQHRTRHYWWLVASEKTQTVLHWNFDSPHFQFECIALKWKPFLRRYSAQKPIRFCVDRGLYQHISARPQKSSTNNRDKESERERERARNEEREPHKLCKMPLKCGIIDFSGMALRMYRTCINRVHKASFRLYIVLDVVYSSSLFH